MSCDVFRRTLLADPAHAQGELLAHSAGCAECAAWAQHLSNFERRLGRALQLNPRAAAAGERRGVRGVRPRHFALAAGLVAAVAAAALLMLAIPRASLARDVVQHMAGEPAAWDTGDATVPPARLEAVLLDAGMRLDPGAVRVSYANACDFRGRRVPHLVVQTPRGPVTVMVLRHESSVLRMRFDEQGYRGVIVPIPGHGALAVLARDQAMDAAMVDAVAARVDRAIVWTG